MEYTGERLVPGCYHTNRDLFYWHLSRYHFAKGYIQRDDIVLDAACGTGYGTFDMASVAKRVVGIDINKECIDYASAACKATNIRFINGDCIRLSNVLNENFNVCVSFEPELRKG